ncbi:MAG: hypothetical protein JJT78_09660 [Leptospira sp.]|nr:hypothetical protein [Leptospira sp.]
MHADKNKKVTTEVKEVPSATRNKKGQVFSVSHVLPTWNRKESPQRAPPLHGYV